MTPLPLRGTRSSDGGPANGSRLSRKGELARPPSPPRPDEPDARCPSEMRKGRGRNGLAPVSNRFVRSCVAALLVALQRHPDGGVSRIVLVVLSLDELTVVLVAASEIQVDAV